jgi:small subunit ribosomal protein S3Ae
VYYGGIILAPGKSSSRVAARKVKDRWRSKNWYRVLAPDMFEGVQIGETLADNPDKLMGRVMDVTLQQLTGDFSKMHIKLHFKIDSISGSDAHSNFIGHSLTSDYIRRLTRRKRSKMDGIYDVLSKDGFIVRVKPFAVTEKRIQTSQQYAIRMKMKNVIESFASDKLVSQFIRDMLSGDLSSRIFKECKPIYPIKRVEIRRSQIISIPSHGSVMALPEITAEEDLASEVAIGDSTPEEPSPDTKKDNEVEPTKAIKSEIKTISSTKSTEDSDIGTDKEESTDAGDSEKKTTTTKIKKVVKKAIKKTTKAKKTIKESVTK